MPPKKAAKKQPPKKAANPPSAAADPMGGDVTGGMWDRLRPCLVRRKCTPDNGPRPTAQEVKQAYVVRDATQGLAVVLKFTALDVRERVLLPELVQGTKAAVLATPPEKRVWKREGLVRQAELPSQEFETGFRDTGFDETTGTMLVVPVLSEAEQKEWLEGPAAFRAKMQKDWLEDPLRHFWVLDGATRRQLCVKYEYGAVAMVAYPDIAYDNCYAVAINRNEGGTHRFNETTSLDMALKVKQLVDDGCSHPTIALVLIEWKVDKPRISRLRQWMACFDDEACAPFLEFEKARGGEHRMWHESTMLSPPAKRMTSHWLAMWMNEVETVTATVGNQTMPEYPFHPASKSSFSRAWLQLFWLRSAIIKPVVKKLKSVVLPKQSNLAAYKGDHYFEDLARSFVEDNDTALWLRDHLVKKCAHYTEKAAGTNAHGYDTVLKYVQTNAIDAWLLRPETKKALAEVCFQTLC